MLDVVVIFTAGVVVGVVYHAKLQPFVAKAWSWLKSKFSTVA